MTSEYILKAEARLRRHKFKPGKVNICRPRLTRLYSYSREKGLQLKVDDKKKIALVTRLIDEKTFVEICHEFIKVWLDAMKEHNPNKFVQDVGRKAAMQYLDSRLEL